MTYGIGVDLGTTSTSAAVGRASGSAQVAQLGTDSQSLPSVASLREDGEILIGEAAERRLVTDPARTIREFKRRFGDAAPIVIADRRFDAAELTGHVLAEVLRRVTTLEGEPPARVALAHPASWGPFRLERLVAAAEQAGLDSVQLVPEPVAAALANRDRLPDGSLVAVYDLGGGTFDAAAVRTGTEVAVVGNPDGLERLGGSDFDQLVMTHVDGVLGGAVSAVDAADRDSRVALARLREDCRLAKEALSADTETEIAVMLPSVRTTVRLTRAELEQLIRPRLADSLAVLDRVVASTGSGWEGIDGVLLVGGSSRIPLVGQLVAEHTGRPVITATNPVFAIAIGTADLARPSTRPATDPVVAVTTSTPTTPPGAPSDRGQGPIPAEAPAPAPPSRRRWPLLVGAAAASALIAVALVVVLGGQGAGDGDAAVAAGDVAGNALSVTPLLVAGARVDPVVCAVDAAIDGANQIAASDASVFVLVDGAVVALTTTDAAGGCGLVEDASALADLATPLPSPVVGIAASASGVLVATSPDGGVVVDLTAGTAFACDPLRSQAAIDPTGTLVLTWDPGGGANVVTLDDGVCRVAPREVLDVGSISAVGQFGEEIVVGAQTDTGARVLAFADGALAWQQGGQPGTTDGYTTVDGIAACAAMACVLDRTEDRMHLLVAGEHRGSVDLVDVLGIALDAGGIAPGRDGQLWVLATTTGADGRDSHILSVTIEP